MQRHRFIWIVLSLLVLPIFTEAQFLNLPPEIEVVTSPRYPGPGEEVSLSARSSSMNLTFATISWFVNGEKVEEGVGTKEISIVLGATGSESRIRVVARGADGKVGEKSFTISPSTVDLLWEAESYTPWFYKGKALVPPRGSSRVVAIPYISQNGQLINNDSLHFAWSFNGRSMPAKSGFGINVFENDRSDRDNTITVSVSDRSGTTRAVKSIIIPRTNPELLLYQNHPVYGLKTQNSLQNRVSMDGSGLMITALPFFVSTDSIFDPEFILNWRVGGNSIFAEDKNTLGLQGTPGSRGTVEVSGQLSTVRQNMGAKTFVEFINS